MSQELQIIEAGGSLEPIGSAYISPVISLERALANHAMLKQYVSKLLREGHDFGAFGDHDREGFVSLRPGDRRLGGGACISGDSQNGAGHQRREITSK